MIRALSRGVRQALQKTLKREFFGYSGEWLLVDSKPVREVIIRDLPVRFRISSSIIRAQLMKHHSSGVCQLAFKEAKTLDFLEQQIRDGDVFYDVGANFGFYVIWAACFAKLEKIVGLEPEALNYAELCQNIHLNQLSNVVALSDGASDVESYEDFHLQKFLQGVYVYQYLLLFLH